MLNNVWNVAFLVVLTSYFLGSERVTQGQVITLGILIFMFQVVQWLFTQAEAYSIKKELRKIR